MIKVLTFLCLQIHFGSFQVKSNKQLKKQDSRNSNISDPEYYPFPFPYGNKSDYGDVLRRLNDTIKSPNSDPNCSVVNELCKKYMSTFYTFGYDEEGNHSTRGDLISTGKQINDLGDYFRCNEIVNKRYILVHFSMNTGGAFFNLGLCSPKSCSQEDFEQCDSYIKDGILSIVNTQSEYKSDQSDFNLNYYDPVSNRPKKDIFYVLAIILLVIVFGLIVLGTFVDNSSEKIERMKNDPKIYPENQNEPNLDNDKADNEINENFDEKYEKESIQLIPKIKSKVYIFWNGFCLFSTNWSLSKNLSDIFHISKKFQSSPLKVFNGIKVFALIWVVYCHEFIVHFIFATNAADVRYHTRKVGIINFIFAGFYAVDIFFFTGGFLLSYSVIKKMQHMKIGIKTYFFILFNRIIRIWPTYAFIILIYMGLASHLSVGPRWIFMMDFVHSCSNSGWENILFIDNLVKKNTLDEYCFPWGWYLACDVQIFIFAALFIFVYLKNQKIGIALICSGILISNICSFVVSYVNKIPVILPTIFPITFQEFFLFYVKSYNRADPYFYGMLVGLLYFYQVEQNLNKPIEKWFEKNQNLKKILLSLAGTLLITLSIFYISRFQLNSELEFTQLEFSLYNTFNRTVFVAGLFLLIFPALFAKSSLLRTFFGLPFFSPLAKIGLTFYLVHLIIISIFTFNSTSNSFLSFNLFSYFWAGDYLISFFVAVLFACLIEWPVSNIQMSALKKNMMNEKKE